MTSQTEQAALHEPSAEIQAVLALAEGARTEAQRLGAAIHRHWGNLTNPGDHNRNAAIFAWRAGCQAADEVHELAQHASAAEATAQAYTRVAAARRAASDPGAIAFDEQAERRHSEARRLTAEAAAVNDVEVSRALTTALYFITLWETNHK